MLFGVVMGLAASASWAAANVFVQRSSRLAGPFRAVVWAQIVGIVVLAPLALATDSRGAPLNGGVIGWAAAAGLSSALAYACLFLSVERARLSIVVPIMSSWSLVAAGLSILVLGEVVKRTHLLGAALVVTGVLIVSSFSQSSASDEQQPDGRGGLGDKGALLAAVGAALGFGVLIPAMDRLAPAVGRLGTIPVVFLIDLTLGVPIALAAGINLRPPPRAAWPSVAAAGVFETVGFVWISLGVARAPVAIVAPLAGLASAFTVLFAWVVLRERPRLPVLAGAALACAGVVTLSL